MKLVTLLLGCCFAVACAINQTCEDDHCVCADNQACQHSCSPGGLDCHIECSAATTCDVTCAAGEDCHVEAFTAQHATVDCAGSTECNVTCPAGGCTVRNCANSSCTVACAGGLPSINGTTATCQ